MTESTLPSGSFKPTKRIPRPYSRPSITVGGGKIEKREWRPATALDVRPGHIIAGFGLVHEQPPIQYFVTDDFATGGKIIKVKMNVGEHGPLTFDSTTPLKVFM